MLRVMQTQDLTPELREGHAKLARAVSLACSYHQQQVRKGTTIPYVSHLLQVAGLVLEYGGDLEQAAAGVLHDALEDTDANPGDIVATCGHRVSAIVVECTDTSDAGEVADPTAKAPWAERKARHLRKLEDIHPTPRAAAASVALVIACDKLHNIRTQIGDLHHGGKTVEFNASYEARKVVQINSIVALYGKIPERLYADLCDAHEEWEQLHELAVEDDT